MYFDWLRSGRAGDVQRVLEHNAQDLVSLAAILAELCRRFERLSPDDAAEDCLSMARVMARGAEHSRVESFALAALERSECSQLSFDALALLASRASRRREWIAAAQWLERAAALPLVGAMRVAGAHLLLAKLAEHGLKDLPRALRHARLGGMAESSLASARRLERLTRRIVARQAPPAAHQIELT